LAFNSEDKQFNEKRGKSVGKDFKSVILMMFSEDQWPATRFSLQSVLAAIDDETPVVVLLKESVSPETVARVTEDFPSIKLYSSANNPGVAGGRNFLMNTPEAREADYIFHLNNGIILTHTYFSDMIDFMERHPEAGVASPLVFAASPLALLITDHICDSHHGSCKKRDHCRFLFDGPEIKKTWMRTGYPPVWHLGASVDWERAYCSTTTDILSTFRLRKIRRLRDSSWVIPQNKDNPDIVKKIKEGQECIEVSNLAGYAVVYRRSLLEQIGGYDEGFNPYLFEDCEFSIRAMKAGYVNYVNTQALIFHGTHLRDSAVSASRTSHVSRRRQDVKTRVLLRRRVLDTPLRRVWSIGTFLCYRLYRSLIHSIRSRNISPLAETFLGGRDGLFCQETDQSRFLKRREQLNVPFQGEDNHHDR
jgi:GT2 family glycosyltransferase